MKRSLSILLVLSMLLTSCLFFASCGQVKPKDFEKDAFTALKEINDKTYDEFLADDAGIAPILRDALKSGSVAFNFEGGAELIGADLKIGETIYFDDANKKYVSDTSVAFGGESFAARIFVDKNGVALNGSDVLGSDKTLAINFKTLAEKFEDSILNDLLFGGNTDTSAMASIADVFTMLKDEYAKLFDDDAEDKLKEFSNELMAIMNMTATDEKLTLDNGKTVNCVVVSYRIDNTAVKAMIDKIVEKITVPEDYKATVNDALTEMKNELDDYTVNLTAKLYADKKTGKAVKQLVDLSVKETGTDEALTFSATTTYSDNEIKVSFNANTVEDKLVGDVTVTKEVKDGKSVYKLVVNAGDGKGATVNFLNATYTYDKASGAISLSADVYSEGEERVTIAINGSINVTKTSAKIEITSVSFAGQTFEFKLSLTFNKSAEMPALPSDAKDIVTLTEAEIVEIIGEISTSKIAKIFSGEMLDPEDEIVAYD